MVSRDNATAIVTCALVAAAMTCGLGCGDSGSSSISVSLYGWLSDQGTGSGQYVEDIGQFTGAQQLRIKVTQPGDRRVMEEQTVSIGDRGAKLPDLDGGDGLRMDFEVLEGETPIAIGSTPIFDAEEGGEHRGFRTMISDVDGFAPVGARFLDGDGTQSYGPSTFDGRQLAQEHIGRVGHTATPTESGEILIVGGAQLGASHEPGTLPELDVVFDDIQLFDPASGHFTELAGDSAALDAGVAGQDRLEQPRAFHTVTDIGNDQFIVAGGFDRVGDVTRPQANLEVIDLNASPGSRVQPLAAAQLASARGMHTATLRRSDGKIVIAGGLGTGDDDAIDTIDIIDPSTTGVESVPMVDARAGHSAVLLNDRETIWFIGGRNGSGVLDSTETLSGSSSQDSLQLSQPRFGAAALLLGSDNNNQVLILGGFTSGGATASYEMANPLFNSSIHANSAWQITTARGQADVFQLPQSRELVVIGGYDQDRNIISSAERLAIDVDNLSQLLQPTDATPGQMVRARGGHSTTPLSSGRILLVGGLDSQGGAHNDAEYFSPHDPVR